jgi:quercetin dioxygenase-like cupin family protein
MHVTRHAQAAPYSARGHFDMVGLRLQGMEASPSQHFWVGLSTFQPRGGAESSASDAEKVYVVLSGEITIVTDAGEITLGALDSCHLAPGERRSIVNRSDAPASMLVVMSYLPIAL